MVYPGQHFLRCILQRLQSFIDLRGHSGKFDRVQLLEVVECSRDRGVLN